MVIFSLLFALSAQAAFYPTVDQGVPGPVSSPWPVVAVTGTSSIGQVTANAGTNLNTSALALESTQSAGNTLTGAVNETSPTADTDPSGLNGRLQRIAQRLTTLITDFGTFLSKFITTTPASNQSALPVRNIPSGVQNIAITSSPTGAAAGLFGIVNAYGTLRVSTEGSAHFTDAFDGASIDTTNRWTQTLVNGGTISTSGSVAMFSTGTTASRKAMLGTQPTFQRQGLGFLVGGLALQIETTTLVTNAHRFWGFGTPSVALTSTDPILDGYGFELLPSGQLRAVVYDAGVVTFSQNLTAPTDGLFHRYGIFQRDDLIVWYQDSMEIPVASKSFADTNSSILPFRVAMINGATPPASTPTFNVMGIGVTDTAHNSSSISDPTFQWRKAGVTKRNALSTAQDQAPTFWISAQAVAIGNGKSMLSIANAAGSGIRIKIKRVFIVNSQTTSLPGIIAAFELRFCTDHSAGTQLTTTPAAAGRIRSADSTDALSGSVTARTGATITAEESFATARQQWSSDEWGPGTADAETAEHAAQQTVPAFESRLDEKPITINPGEGVTVKQVTNSTNGTFDILAIVTQETI